jgi:hypothetical protein
MFGVKALRNVVVTFCLLSPLACEGDGPPLETEAQTSEVLEMVGNDLGGLLVDLYFDSKEGPASVSCPNGGNMSGEIGAAGYGSVELSACRLSKVIMSGSTLVSVNSEGFDYRVSLSGELEITGLYTGTIDMLDLLMMTDINDDCYSATTKVGDNQYTTAPISISACPDVCSASNALKVDLKVSNKSKGPIYLWWVDERCITHNYSPKGIQPGEEKSYSTTFNHLWRVIDESGRVLREFDAIGSDQVETFE